MARFQSVINAAQEFRKLGGTHAERMARAAEQGHTIPVYHGGDGGVSDFSGGPNRGGLGVGYFNDKIRNAYRYAYGGGIDEGRPLREYRDLQKAQLPDRNPTIQKFFLRLQNPASPEDINADMVINALGKDKVYRLLENDYTFNEHINDAYDGSKKAFMEDDNNLRDWLDNYDDDGDIILEYDNEAIGSNRSGPFVFSYINGVVQDVAKNAGFDGFSFRDMEMGGTTYVPVNANQIRSVNADFNPEYKDSPNLLAGIGGMIPYAGGTAAVLSGVAPEEAEAGPLQSLGRAAPYLTSAALGGAAALQSGDAEAGALSSGKKAAKALNLSDWRKVDLFGTGKEFRHISPDGSRTILEQNTPSGRTFFYPEGDLYRRHDTIEGAYADIKGMKISDTKKQRYAEKYGAIPRSWTGESKKVAKRLIDEGIGIHSFSDSSQSASKYLTLDSGEKVRLSDHALPLHYEGADIDYRFGGNIDDLLGKIRPQQQGNANPLLLGGVAAGTAAGMAGAQAFDESRYNDTMQRTQDAINRIERFKAARAAKSEFRASLKHQFQSLVDGVNSITNVAFDALDMPLQGYLGISEALGSLAQGRGFEQSMMRGGQVARQPVDQTTYTMGGAVTDTLSPYVPAPVAAGAGGLTHAGVQLASPF